MTDPAALKVTPRVERPHEKGCGSGRDIHLCNCWCHENEGEVTPRVEGSPVTCRWSYANSMSFAFCETHSDYHRTFLTPPTVCPTAAALATALTKP